MPFVNTQPDTFSTVSPTSLFGGASPTSGYLPANNGRSLIYAQSVGNAVPFYLSLNGFPASTANFNIALKGASADLGGDGGVWSSEAFKGPVFYSGAANAKLVLWENKD